MAKRTLSFFRVMLNSSIFGHSRVGTSSCPSFASPYQELKYTFFVLNKKSLCFSKACYLFFMIGGKIKQTTSPVEYSTSS